VVSAFPRFIVQVLGVGHREIDPFHPFPWAPIEKDEHLQYLRPSVQGHHGSVDGVEVVLLADDEPHIDASFSKGEWEDGVEASTQYFGGNSNLLSDGDDLGQL
jgi:hypothetical protein